MTSAPKYSASTRSSRAPSPSRLRLRPSLRPVNSLSSLRSNPKGAPGTPLQPSASALPPYLSLTPQRNTGTISSASSVMNIDLGDGILIHDADADPEVGDGEDGTALGHIEPPIGDEESRKHLRDQLRRTLTQRADTNSSSENPHLSPDAKVSSVICDEPAELEAAAEDYRPREYFVLTDAGKPVFTSRPPQDHDELASAIGVMQALISVFLDDGDKLRSINAGNTRITFLLRSPLYYVCVSTWKEPESVTRSHLEYLHLQILSVVSGAQLRRIFERRTNFDLRRLLSGAETFLHSLLVRLESDLAMSMSSLLCMKLESSLRTKAAEALVPVKMKDILYVLLVARGRVVTLVRPKKHSVHPADLFILLNTIHAPSIFDSPASWLPICLPKFNSAGFLHAYVSFPQNGDVAEGVDDTASPGEPTDAPQDAAESEDASKASPNQVPSPVTEPEERLGLGLVCVSGGGEFEIIREWCDGVIKKLDTDGTLRAITRAVRSGSTEYSVAELAIPGLRHFVYKSRSQVQITMPTLEDPYHDAPARRRLITLYQRLHDAIHAKSGQEGTLKLQYIRTERESVMGWITQPFELYICLSPHLPKSAVVGAANAVTRWVKREESRLFLKDAPVF